MTIYLDNAATTPMNKDVIDTMNKQMLDNYGNASSLHEVGRKAYAQLDKSRQIIADSIGAKENEIIFTSGGTESNNTAIIQTALENKNKGNKIITTSIEHESVLEPMKWLEKNGFNVVYLPVNEYGQIDLNDFKNELDNKTILVSIMYGNNEVGTKLPIKEIGQLLSNHQALFHVDAVQAYGTERIDVNENNIDLLSVSAHKIGGPKQLGFLFCRKGIKFVSLLKGGEQENKRRAGTENVPAIVGFSVAVKDLTDDVKKQYRLKFVEYKQKIINFLRSNNVSFEVNGTLDNSLAHILNLWIKGISSDVLLTNLDLAGVEISAGSACTAGNLQPSHVLMSMYGNVDRIQQSVRISFGKQTTNNEIDNFLDVFLEVINKLKG